MSDAALPGLPALDLREQLARIDRSLAEAEKLRIETRRLNAQANKLAAEERKLLRDRSVSLYQIIIAAVVGVAAFMTASGGLVGIRALLHALGVQ